jgi:N-acetylneuraminic acid mutarotase
MRIGKPRLLSSSLLGTFLVLAFFMLSAAAQTTAPNEWTWMGGTGTLPANCPSTYNPCYWPGVYGTLGSAASGNFPGGRDSAATWTDSSGNFWLFGGAGFDANAAGGILNDLWEFNPTKSEWTWMGGSSTLPASCAGSSTVSCGQPGVYGTPGTPAAQNIPGGRNAASYWTDGDGDFWLFGGAGFDASGNFGELNDLWMFNPVANSWTWVAGNSTVGSNGGQPGVYGTLETPSAANIPGGRDDAATWIDKDGNLWLYGGEGFDGQGNYGQLDDLWEFNPVANEWVWVGGNSTLPALCTSNGGNNGYCGWPALYGALGVPAAGISPGSRVAAAGWTDKDGNFWLFGGLGSVFSDSLDFAEIDQYDLWELNPFTNQWAWMSGNSTSICGASSSEEWCGQNGINGTVGTPSIANIPNSRSNATMWTDGTGNLWLFGGIQEFTTSSFGGLAGNDVWEFIPSANEWALMNENFTTGVYGSWGVLGTPAAGNIPSGRIGAASWADKSGNFWIFGGYSLISSAEYGPVDVDLNDLWVYQPVTPAPTPSFELVASPNPISVAALGSGAPTITNGTTTIDVVVADGFDSPVTLSAASDTMNGVTDITGSLSPSTITGAGSSQLTVSVDGAVIQIPWEASLTITGTSGSISQTVQVIVSVMNIAQITAPTFSVASGIYATTQTVTISDPWDNTIIYYTADGTTPTLNSPIYVNPITISSTTTLKAIATAPDGGMSAATTATYTIVPPAATPTFSPAGGTYASSQSVTLADSTSGATIYYTTNGTTPTTGSTQYTGAITVSSTEMIQAIAVASGLSNSTMASATYTISVPDFSVAASPVSILATAGSSGTTTVSVTPVNGFDSSVSFACSGLPSGASCTFSPATVTLPGTTSTTLTVATSPETAVLNRNSNPLLPGSALAVALCCIGWKKRRLAMLLLLAVSIAGLGLLSGCGSGGSGSGGSGGGGTQPVISTITVTATSGSLTHTTTLTLTVN